MQKLIASLLLLLIPLTAHTSLPEDSLLVPTDSYGIVIEGVTIVPGIITEGEPGHIEFKPWKPEKFKGRGELEKQWEISFEKEYCGLRVIPFKEGWFISEKLINPENGQELDFSLHPKSKLELAEIDYENGLILTWDYGFHKNLILHDFDRNIRWETRLVAGEGFEPVFIGENIYGIHKSGIWKINTSTGITQWHLSLGKFMYGDFVSSDKYIWIKRRNNQYFRIDPEIPEVLEYNLEDIDDLFVYDENVYIITRQEYFYNTDQELGIVISKIDMCANSSEKDCARRHYEESPYTLCYHIYEREKSYSEYDRFVFIPDKPEEPIRVNNLRMIKPEYYPYHDFEMYWDSNEDELYGLNTKTGEKIWQIQQDILFKEEGLLQDNEISAVYSDNRGVLVSIHSEYYDEVSKEFKFKRTLQCFREKKE